MGLRTSPISEVFLDECEVPATNLLGKPGGGMAAFNAAMEWERSCILASTVGTMQRQLERCIDYALTCKQFGQAIGAFQAVSHRVVDMKLRVEAARLLLYRLGWLMSQRKATPLDSALVKLYLSESAVASGLDARSNCMAATGTWPNTSWSVSCATLSAAGSTQEHLRFSGTWPPRSWGSVDETSRRV